MFRNVFLHLTSWRSDLWYWYHCWNFQPRGLHLHHFHWPSGMGSFVIQPANLVAKILLVEATVDFGRLEKYMDHVRDVSPFKVLGKLLKRIEPEYLKVFFLRLNLGAG